MSQVRSKSDVLRLMQRVGLGDQVPDAKVLLPEQVDLAKAHDRELLLKVGLPADVDALRDRLGGSP